MELLIAAIFTCEEGQDLIDKMKPSPHRTELVQVIKDSTEKGCFEDAKVD
tara:strand:- start:155 stop:304 length:150 start_codon:yes stop_codon:yes gene_type:complete